MARVPLVAAFILAALLLSTRTNAQTIAYYRFEDGTIGTNIATATDSSGNANIMTVASTPAYDSPIPGPVINPGGLANAVSMELDGNDYLLDADPANSVLGTEAFANFTVEGFINFGAVMDGVETLVGMTESAGTGAEAFRDGFYLRNSNKTLPIGSSR